MAFFYDPPTHEEMKMSSKYTSSVVTLECFRVPREEMFQSEKKRQAMDDWKKSINRDVYFDSNTQTYVFTKQVETTPKKHGPAHLYAHEKIRGEAFIMAEDLAKVEVIE